MWTADKSHKCCATCVNWAGDRKLRNPTTVETDSPSVSAKCYAGSFSTRRPGPSACNNCDKYSKWPALK